MPIPIISFDRAFFASQIARIANKNPNEPNIQKAAEILEMTANTEYEELRRNPTNPEYLLCPDIFYGIYSDVLDIIGIPKNNEKILELGINTGGHLMFYSDEMKSRIIGLEKSLPALKVLSENHPEVSELLPIEMHEIDSVFCNPIYATIGANTLYYAKGHDDLERILQGVDRKLTGKNTSGKKTIIHMFSLQPENSIAWGGRDLSRIKESNDVILNTYERFFSNFKNSAFEILDNLGYSVVFNTISRFHITEANRVNPYQKKLLDDGINGYMVEKGIFTYGNSQIFNGEVINPGDFLQVVTVDLMIARKP